MCHLNLFFKKQITNDDDLNKYTSFILGTTSASFTINNDGEGFFFSNGKLYTSLKKLNPFNYTEDIKNSQIIITHQRWATSGRTEEYTQPFETEEFILAHNGVLSDFVMTDNNHSDTYNLFQKFIVEFNSSANPERNGKIVESIKKIFDKLSGSYSIALYDKTTKVCYYFKNSSTSIQSYVNKSRDFLYLTTSKDNSDLFNLLDEELFERDIKDYTIYAIKIDEERVKINKVGKIKEPNSTYTTTCYSTNYDDWRGCYGSNKNDTKLTQFSKEETTKSQKLDKTTQGILEDNMRALGLDFIPEDKDNLCCSCGKQTNISACDLDEMYFCPECIDDNFDTIYEELMNMRCESYPELNEGGMLDVI